MNLGYYELMDRLSVIQQQVHDQVYEHQEADADLQKLLDEAQYALNQAYQYVGEKFNNSCEDDEEYK